MNTPQIKATAANRKILREYAREALADYSPVMTWLLLSNNGDLRIQGQTFHAGCLDVVAETGGFLKAHGEGAARDNWGEKFKTQRAYLQYLLGDSEYQRIFG